MRKSRYILTALLLALLLCLSGCDFDRYRKTPPPVAEQPKDEAGENAALTPDVGAPTYAAELRFERELVNTAGVTLARYTAQLPAFAHTANEAVTERLNSFYRTELSAFETDCVQFFDLVKQEYGALWDEVFDEVALREAAFTYEVMSDDDGYISILRTYQEKRAGQMLFEYHYGDVFLADTGWELSFFDLFGVYEDKVRAMLPDLIADWCAENRIACDALTEAQAAEIAEEYVITAEHVILCAEPYQLSTGSAVSQLVTLPRAAFSEYMID